MDIPDNFDPALFGLWPERAVYDGGRSPPEVKSGGDDPPDAAALRQLLNAMTLEMRAQFSAFRRLRREAETQLATGDEPAGKLARSDVKAASDAMSLIVRTLERIDALQRQLARDRDEAAANAGADDYHAARDRLLQLIEEKANARAQQLHAEWLRSRESDAAAAEPQVPPP